MSSRIENNYVMIAEYATISNNIRHIITKHAIIFKKNYFAMYSYRIAKSSWEFESNAMLLTTRGQLPHFGDPPPHTLNKQV